jgi:SH3 domain protein
MGEHVKKALLLMISLLLIGTAYGETRYVTDRLKITMRSGESTGHKIIRMLPSGTPVEVISRNPASGYAKVKAEGSVGYVLIRQLMDEPSPREQLAAAKQRLQELQEEPDQLQSKLMTLQGEHQALQEEHKELQALKQQLQQELESIRNTSANAVRIGNERNELRKTVAAMTREREDLRQENLDLSNNTAQNWFLIGAGTIIAGIVLGLLLPHLRFPRRKSSWGTL